MADLRYERRGAGAWLILDRPDKLNAITPAMVNSMAVALVRAEADRGVRTIVVAGEGRTFCAGADLTAVLPALGVVRWTPGRRVRLTRPRAAHRTRSDGHTAPGRTSPCELRSRLR